MDDVEQETVGLDAVDKPRKASRIEKSLRARKQRRHVKEIKLAKALKLDKEATERLRQ